MSGEPNNTPSPFHEGEVALQRTVGVADRLAQFGRRVIRDHMPDQHREFYRQLTFIVLGAVDGAGDAWATLLAGYPGFMTSPDPRRLQLATEADPADPATPGLGEGAAVGLLGIELHTRRRNRMNGYVQRDAGAGAGFAVEVEHAYGNCPQYIHLRDYEFARAPGKPAPPESTRAATLNEPRVREMIEGADTFFVASYVEDVAGRHVDASHRGGKPGFVRINSDGSLTIPDFAGNLHFNTLGNFLLNPRAGLVFPDFRTGDLLQLTGEAEVVLDSPEIGAFQGAERLWVFRPRKVVLREAALPLRFVSQADGDSPNNLMTGDWAEVAARLEAKALKSQWRPFRVARIVDESRVIRSIHLEPADGKGIVPHAAGQHLPIRIRAGDQDAPVVRTYTISTAPSDGHYRLSVKRQGLVSTHLHETLKLGDIIEARAPAGHFTIDPLERRPAVLLAAGVGVTPILAMLRTIVFEGLRKRRVRPTYVFVAARSRAERAFDAEIAELQARAGDAVKVVRILADTADARPEDYDAQGRLDVATLRSVLPLDGYDFYLCGPVAFMQGLYDQLRDIGTSDARIHAEAFGPASLKRSVEAPATNPGPPPATQPIPVAFVASGKEARWSPEAGSLLELAEARGLTPEFSCRGGNCGTCAVRVLSGTVAYPETPQAPIPDGSALICCAVPADPSATGSDRLLLDL